MVYLFATIFTYYLLIWGIAHLPVRGSEEKQLEQAYRLRPVLGLVYWLVNAPLLFTGFLWVFSSRWSLSTALQPVWLGLLLLSGITAGAYLRVARLRWPLLVYAVLFGLASPLWLVRNYVGILYQQYPFTVKASSRDYVPEEESFWESNSRPTTYRVAEFHMASNGFDYYMGDVRLEYPLTHDFQLQPALEGISDSIWQRVRSFHFSPDSNQGRLKFSPLQSARKYNAFTDRVELPAEQVVDFWVKKSPEQQKHPK